MNKNSQEPIDKLSARRRLVRGVFAAPVALSLYSGSALAASSNACLTREIQDGNNPAPGTDSLAYVRVQLRKVIRTEQPGKNKYMNLVNGNDVAALQAPGTLPPYLKIGEWQCFSTTINKPDNRPFRINVGETTRGAIPTFGFKTEPGPFVALKIDVVGNIRGVVGIGGKTPGQSAVHASCWTSFRGVAP